MLSPPPNHDFFVENGHYGWCAEKENFSRIRDMMLLAFPVSTDVDVEALPDSMGVATWMQIENQGSVGSCAGHARTSCQELAYYRQTNGDTVQLNRMYAYRTAQERDGIHGDNGSTISGNADCAREIGTPREELWPYPGRYASIPPDLRPKLDTDAKNYRIRAWKELKNYGEVLAWLVHGIGGVDIGILWSLNPGNDGRVDQYRQYGGGHSVALLDWNKQFKDSKGRPYITLFNSWGRNWGDHGLAYSHPDVIDEWCLRQTVVGFSDMIDIKPRAYDWAKGIHFV